MIQTLITDIYSLVESKNDWFTNSLAGEFAGEVSRRLQLHFNDIQGRRGLRLSRMGPKCPRVLWYETNHPELAESLPPWATIKYSYGHILEALSIALAKAAGHTVTGEQDELRVDGIVGHRDCVIDGCIVDVKSTSSISFKKFKDKSLAQNDSFGYLDQLDGYLVGSLQDPLVTDKEHAYILAIDKQLGHMCLYEHYIREQQIRDRIKKYKEIVERTTPPNCECGTKDIGRSGNVGLDTKASYSAYKWECFPGLRCFLYADGPVYLTKVVRKPDVTEIDRDGKIIYS